MPQCFVIDFKVASAGYVSMMRGCCHGKKVKVPDDQVCLKYHFLVRAEFLGMWLALLSRHTEFSVQSVTPICRPEAAEQMKFV